MRGNFKNLSILATLRPSVKFPTEPTNSDSPAPPLD